MELVNYLRIVRRRWRLVAAIVVLGTLIGLSTSLLASGPKGPGQTYYLAKNTLSSSDGTANLQRDAAFCSEGDVPKRVATAVTGVANPDAALVQSIGAKITCEPHADTNLLYVAAADADPQQAVAIANAAAIQLVAYLRDVGEQTKATKVQSLQRQIDALATEFSSLTDEQAKTTDPTKSNLNKTRLADIGRRVNDLKDQQNVAQAQPVATDTLTTLSTAEAVAISSGAYEQLLASGVSGKIDAKNSPTANAARQSQIDAAIKSGSGIGAGARGLIGGAIGLVLGVGLAITLDRIDPRIRAKFEAEEAFGWPVIGEIPPLTRRERQTQALLAYDEPRSRAAEAYRVLRSALLFVQADTDGGGADAAHPIFANTSPTAGRVGTPTDDPEGTEPATRGQVIMVTSPGPAEGKTTTAANMAAILAETGRSVLVVNCDFRRPRVHLYLGSEDHGRQVVDTKVPGVKLVTQVLDNPEDANPAEVVQVQRQVIRNARSHFDIVLLDTAPLLTTNDATEVLAVADQVVIVAKTGKTHREAADRAAELLERRSAPVIGVVLVGATDVPTSRYYYYGDAPELIDPEPGGETETPLAALLNESPGADSVFTDLAAAVTGPAASSDPTPGATTSTTAATAVTATEPADDAAGTATAVDDPTASDATPATPTNGASTSTRPGGRSRSRSGRRGRADSPDPAASTTAADDPAAEPGTAVATDADPEADPDATSTPGHEPPSGA